MMTATLHVTGLRQTSPDLLAGVNLFAEQLLLLEFGWR